MKRSFIFLIFIWIFSIINIVIVAEKEKRKYLLVTEEDEDLLYNYDRSLTEISVDGSIVDKKKSCRDFFRAMENHLTHQSSKNLEVSFEDISPLIIKEYHSSFT